MKSASIKWLFIVILVELLLLISVVIVPIKVSSWESNSSTGDFDAYASDTVSKWWSEYHYGTHDWIAEAALDAIVNDEVASGKWENGYNGIDFWTEKRKVIFYVGTEAPDIPSSGSVGASFVRTKLNGVSVGGLHDFRIHHLYFRPRNYSNPSNWKMKPYTNPTLFNRVKDFEFNVKKYLREGKCDLAAWYMGVICHYISDMSMFLSTLDNKNDIYPNDPDATGKRMKYLHGRLEEMVLRATWHHNNREQYFSYDDEFTVLSYSGLDALKLVAFETRWDFFAPEIDITNPDITGWTPGSYDAFWMYETFRDWAYDPLNYGKQRTPFQWPSFFFERVEKSLNKAIQYNAAFINNCSDSWAEQGEIGISKYCETCNDNDRTNEATQKRVKLLSMTLSLILFMGVSMSKMLPALLAIVSATAKGKIPLPYTTLSI